MRRALNYLYIAYYGAIFIGVFLVLYPVLWLFLRSTKTYFIADYIRKVWGKLSTYVGLMWPIISYEKKLSRDNQYVFCPNHMSYIDIVLTGGFLPTFNFFMAKFELSKIPLFNIWFKTIDVPVKRESLRNSHHAFLEAGKKLDLGGSLIIFPEGRIPTDTPKIKYPFKLGAFKLAIEKKLPLVHVTLFYNHKLFESFKFVM